MKIFHPFLPLSKSLASSPLIPKKSLILAAFCLGANAAPLMAQGLFSGRDRIDPAKTVVAAQLLDEVLEKAGESSDGESLGETSDAGEVVIRKTTYDPFSVQAYGRYLYNTDNVVERLEGDIVGTSDSSTFRGNLDIGYRPHVAGPLFLKLRADTTFDETLDWDFSRSNLTLESAFLLALPSGDTGFPLDWLWRDSIIESGYNFWHSADGFFDQTEFNAHSIYAGIYRYFTPARGHRTYLGYRYQNDLEVDGGFLRDSRHKVDAGYIINWTDRLSNTFSYEFLYVNVPGYDAYRRTNSLSVGFVYKVTDWARLDFFVTYAHLRDNEFGANNTFETSNWQFSVGPRMVIEF